MNFMTAQLVELTESLFVSKIQRSFRSLQSMKTTPCLAHRLIRLIRLVSAFIVLVLTLYIQPTLMDIGLQA